MDFTRFGKKYESFLNFTEIYFIDLEKVFNYNHVHMEYHHSNYDID